MSLLVKDANGINRTLKTTDVAGEHTPHQIVTGPLTDAQLRNSAVAVSGPLTDAQLRNTAVPVSGPLTDAQLRNSAVPVSGPLTDAQLRNSAVPVSGPVTAAQLAAEAIPVYDVVRHDRPISQGVFEVEAGELLAAINIPANSTGVRIYPRDADVLFEFNAEPAEPVLNLLTSGGRAKVGQWREQWIPDGATTIRLRSSEAVDSGDVTPALVDIEFFGTP